VCGVCVYVCVWCVCVWCVCVCMCGCVWCVVCVCAVPNIAVFYRFFMCFPGMLLSFQLSLVLPVPVPVSLVFLHSTCSVKPFYFKIFAASALLLLLLLLLILLLSEQQFQAAQAVK